MDRPASVRGVAFQFQAEWSPAGRQSFPKSLQCLPRRRGSRTHCFSQPKSEKVWKRPQAARVAQLLHLAAKRKLVDSFRSLSGLGTCSLSQLVPNSWGLWGVREDAQSRDASREGGESREADQERPEPGALPAFREHKSHPGPRDRRGVHEGRSAGRRSGGWTRTGCRSSLFSPSVPSQCHGGHYQAAGPRRAQSRDSGKVTARLGFGADAPEFLAARTLPKLNFVSSLLCGGPELAFLAPRQVSSHSAKKEISPSTAPGSSRSPRPGQGHSLGARAPWRRREAPAPVSPGPKFSGPLCLCLPLLTLLHRYSEPSKKLRVLNRNLVSYRIFKFK